MVKYVMFMLLIFSLCKRGVIPVELVDMVIMQDSTSTHKIGSYPVFDGNINEFVKKHMNYPLQARMDSIEEVVYVRFEVDTFGKTCGHHVIWGNHPDLVHEALRISRLISFKRPAIQDGHPIKMSYVLPVDFSLLKDGSDDLIFCLQSMPVYSRGSLQKVINSNLRYPCSAILDSLEGTVYIAFIVDTNGETRDHWVLRGVRFDLDQEALKVTRLIKFDKPAMESSGKPVSILFIYPVKFSLTKIKTRSRDKQNVN